MLVSNIGQADGNTGGLNNDHAQGFTTGGASGGYNLTSVEMEFAVIVAADFAGRTVTASIQASNNSGRPDGTVIGGALTNPAFADNAADHVLTFAAPAGGIDLDPNTDYFFVLDFSASAGNGATSGVRNTASDAVDSGAANHWNIKATSRYRTATGTLWTNFNDSKKIRINGTAIEYPSTEGATQTLHILSRSGQVEGGPVDSGYEGGSNFDVNMFAKALTAIEYKMCFSGTADFGVDYEILKGGTPITDNCATGLRINKGSSAPGAADRIKIKVIKDAVHEQNESVIATLTVTAYPDETTNPLGSYVRGSSKTYTIRNDDDPPRGSTPPVVTISGGPAVDEGDPAGFNMKLDRTPTAPLFVNVQVHVPWAETYWFNTVLVGSSAPLDFEVPATEDDLHFGRRHFDYCAWVVPGDGYTIGGASGTAPANSYDGNGDNCPSRATVRVRDNEPPPPEGSPGTQGGQGDQSPDDQGGVESQTENSAPLKDHAAVIADVRRWADETHNGQPHVDRWMRVLAAFGDDNGYTAMTAAEAREMSKRFSSSRWDPVAAALTELEAEQAAAPDPEPEPDPVPVACVSPELQSDVEGYSKENHNGPDHVDRWLKVLRTFANPGDSSTIMPPEEARVMMETFSRNRWEPVYEAIKCLEEQALQDAL